jgi:flagellar biosynthesis GTPase FlhF
VSRNFKFYHVYTISLISFVFFATNGLTSAQPNLTNPNIQPNLTNPNIQPNLTTANELSTNQQTAASPPSSSITETVNEVLSGSIDGMIGETVDILSSDTVNMGEESGKSSLEEELPSSLTLGRNNQTITQDTPIETRIEANASNNTQNDSNNTQNESNNTQNDSNNTQNDSNNTQNDSNNTQNESNITQNISNEMQSNNESAPDSVDEIKQSFQRSMYNSTIVQSFDNNSFTKLGNQNTFDNLLYKMKNILDTDLFK